MQALQAAQQQRVAAAAAAARNQVNISQQQQQQQQQQQHQQRIASPMAGPRLPITPQQQQQQQAHLLQQQARMAQHVLLQQQQQALAHQAGSSANSGVAGVRAGTSSPRPTSGAQVVPGNAVSRAQAPYMMAVQNLTGLQNYTPEQLQHVVRNEHHYSWARAKLCGFIF
jgi:hypothetical protein